MASSTCFNNWATNIEELVCSAIVLEIARPPCAHAIVPPRPIYLSQLSNRKSNNILITPQTSIHRSRDCRT